MGARLSKVTVKWDGVSGATGYEILKDGTKVATAGPSARTAVVSVDEDTAIAVVDLPNRGVRQEVALTQVDGV